MGSLSGMHWIVLLVVVLILFGAGRLPRVMGDFAKGIKAFKAGMNDEETASAPATPVAHAPVPPAGYAPVQQAGYPQQPVYPPAAGATVPVQPPAAPASVAPGVMTPGAPVAPHASSPPDYRTGSAA